jgi:hypothetical protein
MWAWLRQRGADLFNESKDTTATCPVRLGGYLMLSIMAWKFMHIAAPTADTFQAYGLGAAAILGAMVLKQHVEQ